MSKNQTAIKSKVSAERIDEIMKAAHRERNEAIRQLFGFGFKVVKDALRGNAGGKSVAHDTGADAHPAPGR